MNEFTLYESMNGLDDRLLERSEQKDGRLVAVRWKKWGGHAACLCLLLAAAFTASNLLLSSDPEKPPAESGSYVALAGQESRTGDTDNGPAGTGNGVSASPSPNIGDNNGRTPASPDNPGSQDGNKSPSQPVPEENDGENSTSPAPSGQSSPEENDGENSTSPAPSGQDNKNDEGSLLIDSTTPNGGGSAVKEQTSNGLPPNASGETLTLAEALASEPFGPYLLPAAPSGFTAESIRRYQDDNSNYLSGLWTKAGSYDEIRWTVSQYRDSDAFRVTSAEDVENYDLSLYSIPLCDSVPQELRQIVDQPIFYIDELTQDVVDRRAYSLSDSGDTDGTRMNFSVLYGDIVVRVNAKGIDPEWLYEQLIRLK